MTKSRGLRAPHIKWSQADLDHLRAVYASTLTADIATQLGRPYTAICGQATKLGLKKSVEFMRELGGRLDGHRGSGTRFKPGQTPWSAGRKGLSLSPATQFKPGARPVNWMPLGAHRVNGEGFLEQKVREGNNGGLNWEAVHRLVWKAAHGDVPKGHCVCFKAGRFSAALELITLDAIELLTRKEVMLRNSIWVKNPELARLYHLKGQIKRQVNRIQKETS